MKAFFKDNDKLIINSMDYTEALVGKQFLADLTGKQLKAEQRNDINDDFDGLVLSIVEPDSTGTQVTEEEVQARIDAAVAEANKDYVLDLSLETQEQTGNKAWSINGFANEANIAVVQEYLANCVSENGEVITRLPLIKYNDTILHPLGYQLDSDLAFRYVVNYDQIILYIGPDGYAAADKEDIEPQT